MPKFLVDGSELKCPMGSSSGSLKVTAPSIKGCGKPMANQFDCIPMVNITPFGTCKITKFPCIPATTPWNTSSNVKIRGAPALNEKSCTMCALGGMITPSSSGQSKIRNTSASCSASEIASVIAEVKSVKVASDKENQDDKENSATQKENSPKKVTESIKDIRKSGRKDAHHVMQDAALKDLPGYDSNNAPGVQLPGPANVKGTPHYKATQVQSRAKGGTYGKERMIGYKALRKSGMPKEQARQAIKECDEHFKSIGVDKNTPTRIPGNRKKI